MEQQDLSEPTTIDQDCPGKVSHCNTFFISLSGVRRRNTIGKDAKGKIKTPAKKIKAENLLLKNKTLTN